MSHISRLFKQKLTLATCQHCPNRFLIKLCRKKRWSLSKNDFWTSNNFPTYIFSQQRAMFAPWRSHNPLRIRHGSNYSQLVHSNPQSTHLTFIESETSSKKTKKKNRLVWFKLHTCTAALVIGQIRYEAVN